MSSDLIIKLPDVENGELQKGFTCTGMVYDKNEDCFWVGNIGKALPNIEGFKSSIVKISNDFEDNLGEIQIYELYEEMSDIQGITVDYANDSLWFCSYQEDMLRNISKDGYDLGCINYEKPISIAYDNRTDSLWVLTDESLCNISKEGKVFRRIAVSIKGQDQLYFDEEKNVIYFTAGIDYKGKNFVYKIELDSEEIAKEFVLKDSYAVEGMHIDDSTMYILNDGYYHNAAIPLNQVNIYDISTFK